ncbi:MAG: hypothetical protein JXR53_03805 [Bacteroidales bacterium]|nr:hypothetical protein [Bacteroidales bacterium]
METNIYSEEELSEIALNLFNNNVVSAKIIIKDKGWNFRNREKLYFEFFPDSTLIVTINHEKDYFKYDEETGNFISIPWLGWPTPNYIDTVTIKILNDSTILKHHYLINNTDTFFADISLITDGKNKATYYNESIHPAFQEKYYSEIINLGEGKQIENHYRYRDHKWYFLTQILITQNESMGETTDTISTSKIYTHYRKSRDNTFCGSTEETSTKVIRYSVLGIIESIEIVQIDYGFEGEYKREIFYKTKIGNKK